jgi:hypothetical protein
MVAAKWKAVLIDLPTRHNLPLRHRRMSHSSKAWRQLLVCFQRRASSSSRRTLLGTELHDHTQPDAYHCETPISVIEHCNDPKNVRHRDIYPCVEVIMSVSLVRLIGEVFSTRNVAGETCLRSRYFYLLSNCEELHEHIFCRCPPPPSSSTVQPGTSTAICKTPLHRLPPLAGGRAQQSPGRFDCRVSRLELLYRF